VADVPPRVEVRGFRELAIGSERLFAKLGRSGDAASQQVGDGVAGIVRARVPRRTGALAGTVSADDAGSGVVDVSMGGSLRYGGWIEFGGGHGRPYIASGRYLYPTAHAAQPVLEAAHGIAAQREIGMMVWPTPT